MFVLGTPFLRHLAGRSDAFDQSLWPARRAGAVAQHGSKQGREDILRYAAGSGRPGATGNLPLAVPVPGLSGMLRTLLDALGLGT